LGDLGVKEAVGLIIFKILLVSNNISDEK